MNTHKKSQININVIVFVAILLLVAVIMSVVLMDDVGVFEVKAKPKLRPPVKTVDTITIASWNLQVFGDKKASNHTLMEFYKKVIQNYDIMFLQEIRDKDGSAITKMCGMLPEYTCQVSSRAGTTKNKEQIIVLYKKSLNVNYSNLNDYLIQIPNSQELWERPPIRLAIKIDKYFINIFNIHTKPTNVPTEMTNLERYVPEGIGNIIIIGDLNADCDYYNNEKETHFQEWKWIITDNADTTTGTTNCAYDRIIMNDDAYGEYFFHGIDKAQITPDKSDHYPIWVEITPH